MPGCRAWSHVHERAASGREQTRLLTWALESGSRLIYCAVDG